MKYTCSWFVTILKSLECHSTRWRPTLFAVLFCSFWCCQAATASERLKLNISDPQIWVRKEWGELTNAPNVSGPDNCLKGKQTQGKVHYSLKLNWTIQHWISLNQFHGDAGQTLAQVLSGADSHLRSAHVAHKVANPENESHLAAMSEWSWLTFCPTELKHGEVQQYSSEMGCQH